MVEGQADPVEGAPGRVDEFPDPDGTLGFRQRLGLIAGPLALVVMLVLPPPEGMQVPAWRTAAVGLLMAIWWITEAIPIPATALIPLVLFPILGIVDITDAASPYANPIIFLFLGGFIIAQAMQRWHLHKRIALAVIVAVGTEPVRLIGGFMLAAAFLSMWVSNTATAVMMLPIGLSVLELTQRDDGRGLEDPNFAVALMLGIAYACSIGGLATLIGTPPNALLAGYMLETFGLQIGFGQWMLLGVPLVAIGLPLAWIILTRVAFPIRLRTIRGGTEAIRRMFRALGPWSKGEVRVGVVFTLAAVAWVSQPLLASIVPGISDAGIAITASLLLFLIPVDLGRAIFVLDWESARRVPWEVLLLFGGGLSLAAAIGQTGLSGWIGDALASLHTLPILGLVFGVTAVVIFLTELTSNTATAATFLPIMGGLATGIGVDPLLLAIPAAVAASCAFMLPVATPPNAIVFGSGRITMPEMARAGIYLNLLFTVLITFLGYGLILVVFVP